MYRNVKGSDHWHNFLFVHCCICKIPESESDSYHNDRTTKSKLGQKEKFENKE